MGRGGSTGAVWYLAGAHARTNRRALLLLAVLAAISVGLTTTIVAGARRTGSALDRAVDATAVADVSMDVTSDRLREVEHLDGVETATMLSFVAVRPAGTDLVGGIDVIGVQPLRDDTLEVIDRLRLRGRTPDPRRLDEVAINPHLAALLDVDIGDEITVEGYTQAQVFEIFGAPDAIDPAGARFRATVVGIGSPLDELTSSSPTGTGLIVLSPAARTLGPAPLDLTAASPPEADIGLFRLLLRARLAGGQSAVDRFVGDVFELYGDGASTLFAEAREDVVANARDAIRVDAIALALLAAGVALAGLVAVAQAALRQVSSIARATDQVARTSGMGRTARAVTALAPPASAVIAGLVAGLIGATAASALFPRGLARVLEPDVGARPDLVAFGAGATLALLVLAATVVDAWRATAPRVLPARRAAGAISVGAVALQVGTRLALEPGNGPRRVPNRVAIAGAAWGIAGVIGSMIFGANIAQLVSDPQRSGSNWDHKVLFQAGDPASIEAAAAELAEDPSVGGLTRYQLVEAEIASAGPVTAALLDDLVPGPPAQATLAGRLPRVGGEVAVVPSSVAGPGPEVGDDLVVVTARGEQRVRVVGTLPRGVVAPLVATTETALARNAEAEADTGLLVTWAEGVDVESASQALAERFAEVEAAMVPAHVGNLKSARGYPRALAAFVASVAAAALLHLVVVTARRRRSELAVLAVIGFTPRQLFAVALGHATTVAVLGLAIGVPLGIAGGTAATRALSAALEVIPMLHLPVVAILVATSIALLVAGLIACVPVLRIGRVAPHETLRVE